MEEIARGFAGEVGDLIEYRRQIVRIEQSDNEVTVHYIDPDHPDNVMTRTADWCVCNIPLSILSQIPVDASPKLRQAIAAVPYGSSVKTDLSSADASGNRMKVFLGVLLILICPSQPFPTLPTIISVMDQVFC